MSSSRKAQNDDKELERFHYGKQKQDELIDYFKLTPSEWENWNRERFGDDKSKWRPPLKILIVCDRLLTGFDAPIEQVMYLDKPLRDHNLLQAIARTNRPLPAMGKRTGVVVDYFGVFQNLEKALNFDENIREESLIDWEALKATVPGEVARCMELFKGIKIEDTRDCLLAALRRLRDPEAAQELRAQFQEFGTPVGGYLAGSLPLRSPLHLQLALRSLHRTSAPEAGVKGDLWRACGENAATDRGEYDVYRDR